ncbi:MAG: leucine-rich repeat domain-containing protein [Janthinobacterium lividum]
MKKIFIFVIGLFNLCFLPSFGSITIDEKQEIPSLKIMAIESIKNHIKKLEQDNKEEAIRYAQKLPEDLREIIFYPVSINNRSKLECLPFSSYFTSTITLALDFTAIKNKSFFEPLYRNESLIELSIDLNSKDEIDIEQFIDFTRLKNLKSLKLQYFHFRDINFLKEMENLTTLNISLGKIKDTNGLKYLTNLQTLILNEIELDDVTPISSLSELRCLSLSNNSIKNLTPLSSLKKLQMLILSSNYIKNVTPLSCLPELQRLNLGNNSIEDLTPLNLLNLLKILVMYGNQIKNLNIYKSFKKA